jgi:DNA polymerase
MFMVMKLRLIALNVLVSKRPTTKAVRAFGGTDGLCIVGEAPGSEEVAQGFPFIGPSGKIVSRAFHRAGIDRGRVFITNALLCRRPSGEEDFNTSVDCCRDRLQADLELARPTAICALGNTAMRALQLPVTFVSQARGTVQYSPLLPTIPVVGALHPAALLHGGAGEIKGGKQKMNVDAQAIFLYADIAKAIKSRAVESIPNGQMTFW